MKEQRWPWLVAAGLMLAAAAATGRSTYLYWLPYVIMIGFRFSTWNPPPGFGYLIFATITISAILTVIMTLRAPRRVADDEPGQVDHSGSVTLA